jgi:hypothetical protein
VGDLHAVRAAAGEQTGFIAAHPDAIRTVELIGWYKDLLDGRHVEWQYPRLDHDSYFVGVIRHD